MMIHPREIVLRELSKEEYDNLFAEAEKLGKAYVEALKDQQKRQT